MQVCRKLACLGCLKGRHSLKIPLSAQDSRAFSRQKTIIDTVIEPNHTEADDCDAPPAQGVAAMQTP